MIVNRAAQAEKDRHVSSKPMPDAALLAEVTDADGNVLGVLQDP